VALLHEEKRATGRESAEHRPSGQQDTPGTSQPVDLTNLFAGILMDDEAEEMEEDAAAEEGGCSSVTLIDRLPQAAIIVAAAVQLLTCYTVLVGATTAQSEEQQREMLLSHLQNLPDDADIPGAVGEERLIFSSNK